MVKRLAEEAAGRATDRKALWRQHQACPQRLVAPLFWDQMLPLLDGRCGGLWSRRSQASYKALVSNTHWPQARQARHDPSREATCRLCGDAPGTLWHRRYECPATLGKRTQCTSPQLRRAAACARDVSEEASELFARAVFPDPQVLSPPKLLSGQAEICWINRPASGLLTGTLFTDGSGLNPTWAVLRRAGWAIVQVDRFGQLIAAAYGAVPEDECPLQVARDGEDYAIMMLSQVAIAPFHLFIDCQGTVDCVQKGRSYATCASNPRAHLWGRYYAAFDADGVMCSKTLAHATATDVEAGRTTQWEKNGNCHADKFAKLGAATHPDTADALCSIKACALVVREAARWAAAQEAWMADNQIHDAQSIMDPPMATAGTKVNQHDDHDDDVDDVCDGNFRGHRLVSILRDRADAVQALACLKCGCSGFRRTARLKARCRGARTGLQKRRRDALGMECDPLRPCEALLDIRFPTLAELEWLENGPPSGGKRSTSAVPMSTLPCEALLARFGLADAAALADWRTRAASKPLAPDDVQDHSADEDEEVAPAAAQAAAALPVGPPSATLVGTGSTRRRRFRFQQLVV